MTGSPWGPFGTALDWPERKAQLRALRTCIRILTGPRGFSAEIAVLRAEISGGDEALLAEAESAFDALGTVDRRRVLASFGASLIPGKAAS